MYMFMQNLKLILAFVISYTTLTQDKLLHLYLGPKTTHSFKKKNVKNVAGKTFSSYHPFLPTRVARYPCPFVSWTVSVISCSWNMDSRPGTVVAESTGKRQRMEQ